MEDFDEERFAQGPGSVGTSVPRAVRAVRPARAPGPGELRAADGEREEVLLGGSGRDRCVQVRGLSPSGHQRIQEELQLLAALEVAGIGAAPAVLSLEDDGYVREAGRTLHRGGGRRCAETGSPPTAERLALSRARAELDALIDELHERGWVLGAPPGDGLGVRADGSVLALELSGLCRHEEMAAQQADRRWVDSVLDDQERTLRRRVDLKAAGWGDGALGPVPVPDSAPVGAPTPPSDSATAPAPRPEYAPAAQSESAPRTESAPDARSLPAPRARRRRRVTEPLPGTDSTAETATRTGPTVRTALSTRTALATRTAQATCTALSRVVAAVRMVMGQPRLRRTAALSALTVLLIGASVVGGVWWVGQRDQVSTAEEQPPGFAAGQGMAAPAPPIDDPWALAAELAGTRHAYVTGLSDVPAAAPGSSALTDDQEIRAAYEGLTVHGGGPVVLEAELVEGTGADGTAVLRVVTSTAEHEVEDSAGERRAVPASSPVTIQLSLRWDGTQWQIEGAQQH